MKPQIKNNQDYRNLLWRRGKKKRNRDSRLLETNQDLHDCVKEIIEIVDATRELYKKSKSKNTSPDEVYEILNSLIPEKEKQNDENMEILEEIKRKH